jgi:rhodanese-related sulfurtransferase
MPQPPGSVGGLRSLRLSKQPHTLLDVREPPLADGGHIAGATVVPLADVELRLDALLPVRESPAVVYDDDDGRAQVAADMLRRHGLEDVSVLEGGFPAWQAAGGPVERGRNVPSKRFGETVLKEDPDLFIEPQELQAGLDSDHPPVVFDVRTPPEHRREHVPDACNVPGFGVVLAAQQLDRSTPIVVHCTGRTRGIIAARSLRLAGFENARALRDGTMGWILAGLDVDRGDGRPPPVRGPAERSLLQRARAAAADAGALEVQPKEAAALLEERTVGCAYALDLREPDEGSPGGARGFVPVGSGQLVQQLDEHVAIRGAGVILACDGGPRAYLAAYWLRRLGTPEVRVMEGGLPTWHANGLPWWSGHAPEPAALDHARREVRQLAPDRAAALARRAENAVLSVDPSPAFARAHLPGATWVPRNWLELRARGWWQEATTTLIVSCEDGRRSVLAAAALQRLGYQDVHVVEGGVRGWSRAGLEVATGVETLPSDPGDVWRHPLDIGPEAMRAYLHWEVQLTHGDRTGR